VHLQNHSVYQDHPFVSSNANKETAYELTNEVTNPEN